MWFKFQVSKVAKVLKVTKVPGVLGIKKSNIFNGRHLKLLIKYFRHSKLQKL